MTAGYPDQAAGVILALLVSVEDAMAGAPPQKPL